MYPKVYYTYITRRDEKEKKKKKKDSLAHELNQDRQENKIDLQVKRLDWGGGVCASVDFVGKVEARLRYVVWTPDSARWMLQTNRKEEKKKKKKQGYNE